MAYVDEVIKEVSEKNSNEPEFIQAVTEVLESLRPVVEADDRYEKNAIFYILEVTVYHKKKENGSSNKQIIAKGAVYGKNFNIFICLLVLLRDLVLKKEKNFKYFFEGYNEYFKRTN